MILMMSINRLLPPSVSCTALIFDNLSDDDLEEIPENLVLGFVLNLMKSMEVRLGQIAI